jgi:hypothetical protein
MNHSSQFAPLRSRPNVCKISRLGQAGPGGGDQALAFASRCRRGFQVFLTALLAADRNINYSRENRFRAVTAKSQGPRANIQPQRRGFSR